MIINDLILLEARRNPELNPKLDVVQELSKYKDDESYYIHFGDLVKVGVNPRTDYDTPAGVYAYNLKRSWSQAENGKLPFAHNRDNVFVLEATGPVTNLSSYSLADWKRDKQKIVQRYANHQFALSMDTETFADFVDVAVRKGWNPDDYDFNSLDIDQLIRVAIAASKSRAFSARMWNTTRLITMDDSRDAENIWVWNKLFRWLGYESFYDPGLGIIHKNEPSQALFLTPTSYDVVTMIENKRRGR